MDNKKNIKNILVIEDDQILLKAMNVELSSNNFKVISATDGESGLDLAQKENPDLILLDLLLPKMNGFQVLEYLKENDNTKDIPVLILSNLGQVDDVRKGLELGAQDYYIKASTDLSELSRKIKKL